MVALARRQQEAVVPTAARRRVDREALDLRRQVSALRLAHADRGPGLRPRRA